MIDRITLNSHGFCQICFEILGVVTVIPYIRLWNYISLNIPEWDDLFLRLTLTTSVEQKQNKYEIQL